MRSREILGKRRRRVYSKQKSREIFPLWGRGGGGFIQSKKR
jgi:hypothetical protein